MKDGKNAGDGKTTRSGENTGNGKTTRSGENAGDGKTTRSGENTGNRKNTRGWKNFINFVSRKRIGNIGNAGIRDLVIEDLDVLDAKEEAEALEADGLDAGGITKWLDVDESTEVLGTEEETGGLDAGEVTESLDADKVPEVLNAEEIAEWLDEDEESEALGAEEETGDLDADVPEAGLSVSKGMEVVGLAMEELGADVPETADASRKPWHRKVAGRAAACVLLITVLVSAVLLCFYVGLSGYYKNGFSYGTWINGIYCTGKTVGEVNQELLQNCFYDGITVYDRQGEAYLIAAGDIGYMFSFEEALEDYLEGQNPYLWVGNLLAAKEKKLIPVISYEEDKLSVALGQIPDYADGRTESDRDVEIRKTDDGYTLTDERQDVLDKQMAAEAVGNALRSFETQVDLVESGCYVDLPYSDEMKQKLEQWERIKEFQDCHIVYRFGEDEVVVDASVACDWIAMDEDGNFLTDGQGRLLPEDGKIEEFVDRLADEYDTLGSVHSFHATRGEAITVKGGIYGNRIDRKAEKEYLKQAFRDKAEEVHEPAYLQKGWAEGKDDIGDTYIEVDMTEQMMYYYREGELEIETPIVTGNTGRRMGTPEGVNYVYGKARNRILQGPGYASHVNFWMPVKGNIGIHDAAWRSEYGGEIYKTGGSHGCINTPYDAMSRLYDMAEVGTPVVMFY